MVKEVGRRRHGAGSRAIACIGVRRPTARFAEEVADRRAHAARRCPTAMTSTPAAAFVFTYGTSHHALQGPRGAAAGRDAAGARRGGRCRARRGRDRQGAGRARDRRGVDAEKLAVCREHGADEGIDYATRGPARAHQGAHRRPGRRRDLRPGRRPYTEPALRSIAWRGRFLVIGFAAGEIPKLPLNLPLLKGASIVGVFWGEFARREPKQFAGACAARRPGSAGQARPMYRRPSRSRGGRRAEADGGAR